MQPAKFNLASGNSITEAAQQADYQNLKISKTNPRSYRKQRSFGTPQSVAGTRECEINSAGRASNPRAAERTCGSDIR
jgi:hypothetical protein